MARSAADIEQELRSSIEQSDNTLDTEQGPIADVMTRPQAGQLAIVEQETDSLRTLFTLQFDQAATDDEIRASLANYGSTPGAGTYAQHVQYFMRFTKPTADITIPAGTLVSNSTGDLVYTVISPGTITVASAASFYNPSRSTYEIGILVQATGSGTAYNLPKYRVQTITTPVIGIDSTENRVKSQGGLDSESITSQSNRLKQSLLGINLGSPGGLSNSIMNALPETVLDVAIVQPFEQEFTRLIAGPALDIYVIGSIPKTANQTIIAISGQTVITLDEVPATAISVLTVNGISGAVGYSLVKDTSSEYGSSIKATDLVVLDTPLMAGDIVYIEYSYNDILNQVQNQVFLDGETYLFNTDMLSRAAFVVNPKITGEVQALASYSPDEVEQNVINYLAAYFTFTAFTEIVYPETVRQDVATKVSGVLSFKLTEFRRATGSLQQIEPMEFARNETSVYSADYVSIRVIK